VTGVASGSAATPAVTSVLIVNFNGRQHLEHCVPALEAQTRPADEVIVVDNNSTDDSVDYLRTRHPRIRIVQLGHNQGFAGGNIAGYEVSSGAYIVLLNNDTKPLPNWLERLTKCADEFPDVGIVASHLTDWEGDRTDSAGDGCSVTGRGFKLRQGASTEIPLSSGYVFSASAGAALYKRAMLDQIGFLDPRFYMNAEDTDLAFRAQLRGWRSYFCADAVVRHRIGASQGVHSASHIHYSARNHAWLYLKCMPGRLMLKYWPARLLHSLLYLAFFARNGHALTYLGGLWAAARALPAVLSERRAIQKSRTVPVHQLEARLSPLSEALADKVRLLRNRR
jgi:GT2 family glycosyltransferase